MIIIKNKLAIDKMRHAGHILAQILEDIRPYVIAGASTYARVTGHINLLPVFL